MEQVVDSSEAVFATFELEKVAKDTLEWADLKRVSVSLTCGGMHRISRIELVE